MAKTSRKSKALKVDFSGVESSIRRRGKKIPEGDYLLKIVDCEKRKKEGASTSYLNWKLQVVENAQGQKKQAGVPLYYVTSLKPDALFNLRNLIYAATDGKTNVAGKAVTIDPKKYFGKLIGGTVEDEEYDGKMRSKLVDVMPKSQLEAEDEDDDDDEEEEDDDDEEEDEDEDEDDEDDDEEPVKKKKGKKGKKGKRKKDTDDEDDEDDLDDVDDDDL